MAQAESLGSHKLYELAGLLPALEKLDTLLAYAVPAAQAVYGADTTHDRFRGLYIPSEEATRLLNRAPGVPVLYTNRHTAGGHTTALSSDDGGNSRLAWLQATFDLDAFDMDLLVLALAPELDRRYERLYAYLQDHVARRWPTVDLALHLLCPDAVARLERRAHFDPAAPLIRHGLIRLLAEPDQLAGSLLGHTLKLDEQIVRFVLHQDGLDARLTLFCRLTTATVGLDALPFSVELKQTVFGLAWQAQTTGQAGRIYFQGRRGLGKHQVASALAGELGAVLLHVNLAEALATPGDFADNLRLIFRYAQLHQAVPYLDGVDVLLPHALQHAHLLHQLASAQGITLLAGVQPWQVLGHTPLGVTTVTFQPPDFVHRRLWWQTQLAAHALPLAEPDLDTLAGRFRLTPAQIAEAMAVTLAAMPAPDLDAFVRAARAQSGHELAALAHKIQPFYTWQDLVLPADTLAQLYEICRRVTNRHQVLDAWGFGGKLSLGKGVNALFAGPSGAGKTMAAEVIANELALDLYKIDLSGVVSKYIGETEKNLDRIFQAAADANAILFFDEADALFGKRSEVRDSHDRYANIEISYLLQKMEEYDGLAILATNLRQNLDESFVRRLAFTIHFPFPDETSRLHIWQGIWPLATPLAADVDLAHLARQFKLAGGNIKNIALAAAFLAATDDSPVTMLHLLRATGREYQKLGKTLSEAELSSGLAKP